MQLLQLLLLIIKNKNRFYKRNFKKCKIKEKNLSKEYYKKIIMAHIKILQNKVKLQSIMKVQIMIKFNNRISKLIKWSNNNHNNMRRRKKFIIVMKQIKKITSNY